MLLTHIKRRCKGYLEPSGSRWLAAPYTRDKKEEQHTAAFGYTPRSELTNALLDGAAYNYDNIGNYVKKIRWRVFYEHH